MCREPSEGVWGDSENDGVNANSKIGNTVSGVCSAAATSVISLGHPGNKLTVQKGNVITMTS